VYNAAALVGLGVAQQVVVPIVPSWA
jgi:hypothetical protein